MKREDGCIGSAEENLGQGTFAHLVSSERG